MSPSIEEMDRLEAALTSCMRVVKRPGYWEKFSERAGINIDRPGAAILMALYTEHCQFQKLVTRLGVEAPSVSRKVHALQDEGLIVRKPTDDRRVHELHLSDKGRIVAERLLKAKRQMLAEVISDWSGEQKKQLIDSLDRFATEMKRCFDKNTK